MKKAVMFLSLAIVLSSCVSNAEGKLIKADIKALEKKHELLKVSVQDNKNAIDRSIKRVDTKLAELDDTLKEAKKLLRANNANFGQDLVAMEQNVQKISGKSEEIIFKFEQLEKQMEELKTNFEDVKANVTTIAVKKDETQTNIAQNSDNGDSKSTTTTKVETDYKKLTTAKEIFNIGYQKVLDKSYSDAREILTYLIKKFPKDNYATSSQYWISQTYFAENDYKNSFLSMNTFIQKYPKSNHVPQILYQMGFSAKSLKLTADSIEIFKQLIKNFPSSSYSKKAKTVLQEMK
ncbi:outer membrane protein assembly factor BamD [bacterium]|nr:outer membrane protein assembly factor BamD [bacterium]